MSQEQQSEATAETTQPEQTGVESTQAEESSTSKPGSTQDASPELSASGEATPVAEPESWSGELEALEKAEWYKALPDSHKGLVQEGLKQKLGNYERGFQQKFRELASQKQHLDEEIRAERDRIQRMLYGVDDPTKDVRSELDRALADQKKLEGRLKEHEEKALEAQVDELLKWVETNGKEVYQNDDAWKAFCKAIDADFSRPDALKMAQALVATPTRPAVPDSISMMNMDSSASNTERAATDDYETVRRRLLAQAGS